MSPAPAPTARNRYNPTAWFYQPLATLYSLGQIPAAKASQVAEMRPGDRVLYAGVGPGEDALLAARRGAALTCVDLAPAMLARTRDKLAAEGLTAEYLCADVMAHERAGHYDAVCAIFFLNVFDEAVMRGVLAHLARQLRPGGKLLIADFAVPRGSALARAAHVAYYRVANGLYWAISGNTLHPIYDYPAYFPAAGLRHEGTRLFRPLGRGPACFAAVVGRKPD